MLRKMILGTATTLAVGIGGIAVTAAPAAALPLGPTLTPLVENKDSSVVEVYYYHHRYYPYRYHGHYYSHRYYRYGRYRYY